MTDTRRVAHLTIGPDALRTMLRLPLGSKLRLAAVDVEKQDLVLEMEHPELPDVALDATPPQGEIAVISNEQPDLVMGAVTVRVGETVIPGQAFVHPKPVAPSTRVELVQPGRRGYRPTRGPLRRV